MSAAHDTQALAACPCCGSTACELSDTSDHIAASIGVWDYVVCNASKGGCGMRSGYYDSAEEAISAWNHRPALASCLQGQEGQPALAPLTAEERAHVIGVLRRNHDEEFINRIRATLAAGSQAVQVPGWKELTDEDRDRAFNALPDMLEGFMKKWGWLHFAKAIEAICREKNAAPLQPRAGGEVPE